ncbi:MAG: FAD:protein FMN transferase [Vicingaceae bacterium]|nr:FAD:protein FMN transferase [Vicingaceae bacterium]
MKNLFYFVTVLFLISCGEDAPVKQEVKITGYAQGTTYSVVYISEGGENYQRAIDSTLIEIDNSMSTYQKNSLISKWNQSEDGEGVKFDENFVQVYNISENIFKETQGFFDPTVAPLVNAWGFGFEKESEITQEIIDSTLFLVGFNKLVAHHEGGKFVTKINSQIKLDFNAVAQGYTVDVLGELLEKKGVSNYLVEVGGELRAKGNNIKDTLWRVGIDRPLPDLKEREIEAIVHLDNLSLATSGNYRKFYEKDGKKYSHTINPKTGYPVEHNLLSATVITKECAYADAYATAFMVMGLEKSKTFLASHKELMALLIFSDENGDIQTFTTKNLSNNIELNPNKN